MTGQKVNANREDDRPMGMQVFVIMRSFLPLRMMVPAGPLFGFLQVVACRKDMPMRRVV